MTKFTLIIFPVAGVTYEFGNYMFNSFDQLTRLVARLWYPVSLPEDVAEALGLQISNLLSFEQFISQLTSPRCIFSNLSKYMPRSDAEAAFSKATSVEQFGENTLISYFFPQGWIEFILKFDRDSKLRRIYLVHKGIENEEGLELLLPSSYIGYRKTLTQNLISLESDEVDRRYRHQN